MNTAVSNACFHHVETAPVWQKTAQAAHKGLGKTLQKLGSWALFAIKVSRQRQELKCLPAEQLMDIGLTKAQAQAEAKRPFWDLPN
ncbi:hypothetical protein V5T82_06595 [Magnetovibrio sp. PR-2]|uniref:DUF1127 domain-containing protein n=1 Tax=Magnetovibrio sp. PR-2 TaxID=3120356 RepID=UPI002FCE1BA3